MEVNEYKITLDQINQIVQILSESPLKYSLPVVDLLRSIMKRVEPKLEAVPEIKSE